MSPPLGADAAATRIQARYRGHHLRQAQEREYNAASKLQARYRGFASRKASKEARRRRDEQLSYEKASREREYRMKQREEQKAMLLDLPAGEVEDWQARQEQVAATTVQAGWKRHKARKDFGAERQARAAAASTIQRGFRKHARRGKPHGRRRNPADEGDAADVLIGSADWGARTVEEMFDAPLTGSAAGARQKSIDQVVHSRKMEARREWEVLETGGVVVGGGADAGSPSAGHGHEHGPSTATPMQASALTMAAWSEGRQRTRKLLEAYRVTAAPKAATAAAARRGACRLAEGVYLAQRAARHGSLAALPSGALPAQFPSPAGVDDKVTRRLHAEALEAAQVESKWWKPLLGINREQKVLDQHEEVRRAKEGDKEGGANIRGRYQSNRNRAGVHLRHGGGGGSGPGGGGGFGIGADLY